MKANNRQLALIPVNSTSSSPVVSRRTDDVTRSVVPTIDHSGCENDEALVELFLQTRAPSTRSQRVYRYELQRFRATVSKLLARVTLADLQGFAAALEGLGLATATRARAIATVRSLLRFAHETGYLPYDVGRALRPPRKTETNGQRYLTPGEAERLLDAARERGLRDLLVVAVLLGTGLRCAELAGASWGDVFSDPDGRVGLRVHGKGGKVRDAKIRCDLWCVIVAERTERGLNVELDPSDVAPLVVNRSGKRLTERGIHRVVVACAKKARLKKAVSPHWLRHTHATLSLQGGATVVQVREQLGHASLATSSIYLHAALGLADTAADHLPVRFVVD